MKPVRFEVFILTLLLGHFPGSALLAQQNNPAGSRVLSFPNDRSLGDVYVGQSVETKLENLNVFGDEFKMLGPAQGEVAVPENCLVRLDVSLSGSRDLTPLSRLPANAIHLLFFNIDAPIDDQLQHISHLTGLRVLFIRGCPVTDKGVSHLANLINLEWVQCSTYGHTDEGFGITDDSMPVFQEMKELKRLDLRANPITDEGLIALSHCNSLQSLGLSGSKVTGVGVDALLMLPDLNSLSFGAYKDGSPVDDRGMEVLGQLDQLEHLNLSSTAITDDGFKHIKNLSNLKTLTLDNTDISDDALQYLTGLENLTRIRFYPDQRHLGDVAAKHLSEVPNLEKVTTHWSITSEGIKHLSRLKKLESIDFSRSLVDADLQYIGKMTGLKDLGLQNCPITDTGISMLVELSELEQFSLHGTKATASCLKTLVSFPRLRILRLGLDQNADAPFYWPNEDWSLLGELQDLEYLTIDGLLLEEAHWSPLTQLKNLQSLEIRNLAPLDSSFLNAIAQLPNLRTLNVQFADFSDEDFEKLATFENLEYLEMIAPIGESALVSLSRLPRLRILQCQTNRAITDEAIERFKQDSPSLQTCRLHTSFDSFPVIRDASGILVHARDGRDALDAMIGLDPPGLFGDDLGPISSFDLQPYMGKIVVVHFWQALSIGREPRPDEVHVRDVVQQLESEEVQVIGVHRTDPSDRMSIFVRENGIEWPCFRDLDSRSATAWNTNGRRNMIYLVNREGKLKLAQVYQGDLERALRMMLADEKDQQAGRNKNAR